MRVFMSPIIVQTSTKSPSSRLMCPTPHRCHHRPRERPRIGEGTMKAAYKWLAFIIAAEVVVQAAAIAFGYARLGKYVDGGATLTKDTDSFPGMTSLVVHGVNGMMVIPALAIAFL